MQPILNVTFFTREPKYLLFNGIKVLNIYLKSMYLFLGEKVVLMRNTLCKYNFLSGESNYCSLFVLDLGVKVE